MNICIYAAARIVPPERTGERQYQVGLKPEDYNLLLVFLAGSYKSVTRKLKNIKTDFTALRNMLEGSGVQVVFYSIFPTGGWNLGRKRTDQLM